MPLRARSAFVIRRLGPTALLVPALAWLAVPGCSHSRTSLRPIYRVPVAAPATITPAPCPPGSPCATSPAAGFPDSDATLTSPPVTAPASPPTAPVAPESGADEPGLNLYPKSSPSGGAAEPPVDAPKTSRRNARPSTRVTSRATLKSQVQPYLADPDDLFLPPRADRPWRYVVLHHSAHATGGYAQIDREHRAKLGTDGCGYHFVIGNGTDSPDGRIEVARRWSDQKGGAHCRNAKDPAVNDYGIGICLVGDLDHGDPTPKQIEAARALVAYLRDRYQIPAAAVGTHAVLAAGPTACPGKHFPVEAILGTKGLAMR